MRDQTEVMKILEEVGIYVLLVSPLASRTARRSSEPCQISLSADHMPLASVAFDPPKLSS
jgi:hypothetical protein